MKKYFLFILMITVFISCESELSNPNESGLFIKLLGTPENNEASELIENESGNFIIVGGVLKSSTTQNEIILFEVDNKGNTIWQKVLDNGLGKSVKRTNDGGYIVLGSQVQENNFGLNDFVLIKTNNIGDTIWTRSYGNDMLQENAIRIDILEDGSYIMLGNIEYDDNSSEMWILKTDQEGNISFDKKYGLIDQKNEVSNILVLENGDIVSCGTVTQPGEKGTDIRIVLADEQGNVKWDKVIQLPGNQTGTDIKVLGNGFIVTGITDHETNGGEDIFLAKISNLSNIEWTKVIGEATNEGALSVYPAQDGLAVLGYAFNVIGSEENKDIFFIKTDFQGNEQWHKIFGGNGDDEGISVIQNSEKDYVLLSAIYFANNDMMGLTKFNEQGELTE